MSAQTIMVIGLGGTIAGQGEAGSISGYTSGVVGIDTLLSHLPFLPEGVTIVSKQLCNLNSDDITSDIWLELAYCIEDAARTHEADAFVVVQGTDTLEETAFFLNEVLSIKVPVVLTGSMRPGTALSPDGTQNLYQALCVAACNQSRDKGVLVVFNNKIFAARDVEKVHTDSLDAFAHRNGGSLGFISDNEVAFTQQSSYLHTHQTNFSLETIDALPPVAIIPFYTDADPVLIELIACNREGLVIEAAGGGEMSAAFVEALEELSIPVVVCTRVKAGCVYAQTMQSETFIAGRDLSPQKAGILLRLALTCSHEIKDIKQIFLCH